MDDGPDLSALAPVWVTALERAGLTSPARVELWRDEHPDPPPVEDVDLLLRRARGEAGVMDLAAERNVPHSRIQALLRQTGLRLIAPPPDRSGHLGQSPGQRSRRRSDRRPVRDPAGGRRPRLGRLAEP